MKKKRLNIVWLKRDLRTQDHLPFYQAEQSSEEYIPIYIFEPSAIAYPDCSLRHLQFIYHSIKAIDRQLEQYGRKVIVFHAEAQEVFDYLSKAYKIHTVFSYQESGIRSTWERDKTVAEFLKREGVEWKEFQRDGVIRGIRNRNTWDQKWFEAIKAPIIKNSFSHAERIDLDHPYLLPVSLNQSLVNYPKPFQKAGESYAWKYLRSFCKDRGKNYSKYISKPLESRTSCARISPYLAWGNLSIKQAYQCVLAHENYSSNKRSFNGLLTRLKWHCHFIQKFEMECDYETRCVNKGYESLGYTNKEELLNAWMEGETGFPLVDACMRCLKTTGWINFRMRAMLVSVLCFHLDCDWRKGVYHLANLFLDYEPGIHFTQFQMQAGTTGVNTIRMYNPIKQSKDHDPNGIFIKEWIPELRTVPEEFIHEPWNMTELDRIFSEVNVNYGPPVVDLNQSAKKAREKVWKHRKDPLVKSEGERIVRKHTRGRTIQNQKAK